MSPKHQGGLNWEKKKYESACGLGQQVELLSLNGDVDTSWSRKGQVRARLVRERH